MLTKGSSVLVTRRVAVVLTVLAHAAVTSCALSGGMIQVVLLWVLGRKYKGTWGAHGNSGGKGEVIKGKGWVKRIKMNEVIKRK